MIATTVFDHTNAAGAKVADVEAREELQNVMRLDTAAGEVVMAEIPLRVNGDEIATKIVRFETIHPIYGGHDQPVLFHCYARAA